MAGPAGEAVAPESRGAGEGGQGRESGRGEGGSSARDEASLPHNLDLRGGVEGGEKNWAA
jgi:hypothetical protein